MLVIKDGPDGYSAQRRWAWFPRVIKHVAILSTDGYPSLDAIKWTYYLQITWSVIDNSGETPSTLATSGRYVNPVFMRRQAMVGPGMPAANTGRRIMAYLITRKLEGQAHNLERILGDEVAAKGVLEMIDHVAVAKSVNHIMGFEGMAAVTYFNAWRGLSVAWKGAQPLQPHWPRMPGRTLLLASGNRGATDPVNAMLNYGYKCAETECTLAEYACALSPAMGIGHVDRPGRDSFALDLQRSCGQGSTAWYSGYSRNG